MMQENYPNYLVTGDNKKIFYNTNFNPLHPHQKDGPLLIFNYGLVCSNFHWSKQIPFFDKRGHKILIHNYRGHYNSSGQDDFSDCNFQNMVKDLKKILDLLEVEQSFMLGHSMGVNVTLEFAKEFPKYVKGIVLISGTVLPPEKTMFDSRIMEIVFPLAKYLEESFPQFFKIIWDISPMIPIVQKSILYGGFNPEKVPLEFIQTYMNKIKQLPPKLFFKLFEFMGEQNLLASLDSINAPALIISGEKDKIIPNHFQEILKNRLKNSEFYLVKDGSHVPQVDFSELINHRISAFIFKHEKR